MNELNALESDLQERVDPLGRFSLELTDAGVEHRIVSANPLPPAHLWEIIQADAWGKAAAVAQAHGWRWVAGWAEDEGAALSVSACLELQGSYVVLRTRSGSGHPALPSQAAHFFSANRPERHMRDLFGIEFIDHPDPRRWTRHQAWGQDDTPLRKSISAAGSPLAQTPPDQGYPFFKA
jgi:hypothetical protein